MHMDSCSLVKAGKIGYSAEGKPCERSRAKPKILDFIYIAKTVCIIIHKAKMAIVRTVAHGFWE